VRIWLTKKFAEIIDGVDLTDALVGDVLDVSRQDGRLLIAEEWAVELIPRERRESRRLRSRGDRPPLALAADRRTAERRKTRRTTRASQR